MSPRRCSCCLQTGHNISRCNDETAHDVMDRIMNSDIDTALSLVDTIPNNQVSFVLVRGYHLSVRLNRNALRLRVIQERTRDIQERLHVIQRNLENRARADVPPTNVPPTHSDSDRDRLNISVLHLRSSQLVNCYYITHPQTPARVSIYNLLVSRYLKRLERAARGQSDIEFNRYISLRLCTSIATACESLREILADHEIRHVDNMTRMYNYDRLLENSNTFEIFWPSRIEKPEAMKVLPIKITVCEPCQPEDTCGVCFDELPSEKLVKTGCGHTYCSTCIAGVAHQRGIKSFIPCPGCRADIVELKVYNEEEHQLVLDGLKPV